MNTEQYRKLRNLAIWNCLVFLAQAVALCAAMWITCNFLTYLYDRELVGVQLFLALNSAAFALVVLVITRLQPREITIDDL